MRSRRKFLRTTGVISASGIAALAGCNTTNDGGNGSDNGGSDDGNNSDNGGSDGGNSSDNGGSNGGDETYTMRIATAFPEGINDWHPLMQTTVKENIEAETDGRVEVEMHLNGSIASGPDIPQAVQNGTVEAGLHSLANWSQFTEKVDMINLPYLFGQEIETAANNVGNLVNSDIWAEAVDSSVRERNFEPHAYLSAGPRVLGIRDGFDETIRTPDQIEGADIRAAPSPLLEKAFNLLNANPVTIDWGETPQALQEGVADGLHVAIGSIYQAVPDILGFITTINMVQSAFVYSINREWYQGLPDDVQEGLDRAGQMTHEANIEHAPTAFENCLENLEETMDTVDLEEDERQQWVELTSYERDDWEQERDQLSGDYDFEEFENAISG